MGLLTASLLTASLPAGFAGSASAQEPVEAPTPTAGVGQRLEFDEPSFAATVPGDWEVELRPSEFEGKTAWAWAWDEFVTDRSLYQVPIGETSLRVACLTSIAVAPDDRWRSIMEAIEFLSEEEK
ncbi:MAG: hypothetical protein U9O18_00615 [Chloroflexota bacterium]|nr:hypothetical protein [Chloroflexota bacterium]